MAPGAADSDSVLAQIRADRAFQFDRIVGLELIHDWHLDRNAPGSAALALHQRPGRAETGLGPLRRYRLVEDKIGAQLKSDMDNTMAVNKRYCSGIIV